MRISSRFCLYSCSLSRPFAFRSSKRFSRSSTLGLAAAAAYGQNWLTGSVEDALAKAKAQNKLLLLDFFQEGG